MEIVIDHQIRDWVFIPLIFVMFMVGIFRFYLQQYSNYNKTPDRVKGVQQFADATDNNILSKCSRLIQNNGYISDGSFRMRKSYYCKKNTGLLYKHSQAKPKDPMNMGGMMMNSKSMSEMLKNNLSMGVSTMLQYAWVSYFFSGFILAKVPFPLTQKFRVMLQRGVEIQNLDVRYVSSLSLYFLVLCGLGGLQSLILGTDMDSEEMKKLNDISRMPGMNPMMGAGMPGQQQDFNKMFTSERENIELVKHKFALENADDIFLDKLRAMRAGGN